MSRQDNPFSLLGEDDDGGDVAVFLAKVEAKISISVAPAEQSQPKSKGASDAANGFPSKPLPPAEYVRSKRGRGRGNRGRGHVRGGFGSTGGGNGNFNDDSTGQFPNRYPRDFGGGGRGGRGRGSRGGNRARSYYEDCGIGNENQLDDVKDNQVRHGEWSEVRAEFQGKGYEVGDNRGPSFDNGHLVGGTRSSQWEERRYGGESRRSRGFGDRDSRAFGAGCGPRGGGGGRRFGGRGGAGDEGNAQMSSSHDTEVPADIKGQAADNTPIDFATLGGDVPEITDAPKVVEPEQVDSKQALSENVPEEKAVEEEKEMTLDEYEKLLTEKRKALESLKNQERKVVADEDFQRMQLIEKKKEEEHFAKLKSEKDKLKKKDSIEKEEKVRKSLSIKEFLKPAEGENYVGPAGRGRGRGRGDRGGGYAGRGGRVVPAPRIEDPGQFPLLGVAVAPAIKA